MVDTRHERNLQTDITYAHQQLKAARADGGYEQIGFWARRLDQLVDRLCEHRKQETHA